MLYGPMQFFSCSLLKEKGVLSYSHPQMELYSIHLWICHNNQPQSPQVLLTGKKKKALSCSLPLSLSLSLTDPICPSSSLLPFFLHLLHLYHISLLLFCSFFLFAPESSFSLLSLSLCFSPSHSFLPACSPSSLSRCSLTPLLLLTRSHVVHEGGMEGARR